MQYQGFQRGFERRRDLWNKGRQARLPGIGLAPAELRDELDELFEATIEADGPAPLFVWIHLFHPHGPYGDPRTMPPFEPERTEELRARYRADILESDACLGVLDDRLQAHDRGDALKIVTSDHGEEFNEHDGLFLHGGSFYNTLLHVPCIPMALPSIEETDVGASPEFPEVLGAISRCTRPFSYLGLPALSMPVGFTSNGLPAACQLVGRPFAEARLLEAAAAYETATDWTLREPPV